MRGFSAMLRTSRTIGPGSLGLALTIALTAQTDAVEPPPAGAKQTAPGKPASKPSAAGAAGQLDATARQRRNELIERLLELRKQVQTAQAIGLAEQVLAIDRARSHLPKSELAVVMRQLNRQRFLING
jgi:hypothetical protein